MKRNFLSGRDVHQSLGNCVLYSNEHKRFVYIISDRELGREIALYDLGGVRGDPIQRLDANKFDFDPDFQLGYLNMGDSLWYLSRMPLRQWKFGLCSQNIKMRRVPEENNQMEERLPRDYLTTTEMSDMLANKYPSFLESLEFCREDLLRKSKLAFHKDFSLISDGSEVLKVYFKTLQVGHVMPDTDKISISKIYNSKYFANLVKDTGVKVA